MSDPFVAMVLLGRPASFNGEAVVAELRRQRVGFSEKIEAVAGPTGGQSSILTIGSDLVTVMVLDAPLPAGTLDLAITGNLLWPDAGRVLSTHRAHVIVGSLGQAQDITGRVTAAANVTWVCAAIAALTPSLGVYWVPSETVDEAKRFQVGVTGMSRGIWPVYVWFRFHLFTEVVAKAHQSVGCVTMGLFPFVGREIEFLPAPLAPNVITEKVLAIVLYLLEHGQILKHGDTLGETPTERIQISHADKGERINLPVLSLIYESESADVSPTTS